MSTNFYVPKPEYPLNLKSAVETYLQYISSRLYPNELPKDRLVLSNIGNAGSEGANRYAIEYFQKSNLKYPFTAYSIGELEQDESRINHFAKSGNYFDTFLDCYVSAIPSEIEVSLISFFSNAFDYNRARTILLFDFASLTRLYYPIRVNGRIIKTALNVNMEQPTKGSYSYEFEETLRQGRIFDIIHTVKLQFNELIVNTERDGRVIPLYPVESVDLSIIDFLTGEFIENENYVVPRVESTSIVENEVVDRDTLEEIVFVFTTEFINDLIPDIISSPELQYDYVFDNETKSLTLTLLTPLYTNQEYTITINPTIISDKGVIMQKEFTLNFRTK